MGGIHPPSSVGSVLGGASRKAGGVFNTPLRWSFPPPEGKGEAQSDKELPTKAEKQNYFRRSNEGGEPKDQSRIAAAVGVLGWEEKKDRGALSIMESLFGYREKSKKSGRTAGRRTQRGVGLQ